MSFRIRAITRALVIEDDATLRETLCATLNDEGVHAVGCGDLAAARSLLVRAPIDVVVLDLALDGSFADELLDELSTMNDPPAVIVCSGFQLAPLVAARFAVPCLPKPLELTTFVDEVRRAADDWTRPRPRPAAAR